MTEADRLVEEVARAICAAFGPDCPLHRFSDHERIARAAISVTLEAAAKKLDISIAYYRECAPKNDVPKALAQCAAIALEDARKAIRSLTSPPR